MIEFSCSRRKPDMTPVIRDALIQDYAEALIGDYKPKLLKEPGKLNATHFVESYLGANLDYQDIYYPEDGSAIAGATVFNRDYIKVFDREQMCTRSIEIPANTILIDNSTMADGKKGFAKFTVLHEGGHFCIHPAVYRRTSGQLSFFDMKQPTGQSVVCCRKASMDSNPRKSPSCWTEEDFREHQANVFAAAAAMPRQTFIPYAQSLIQAHGYKNGIFIENDEAFDWCDPFGFCSDETDILETLAETYSVSKASVKVHLKRLGLYLTSEQYEQQHSQFAVDF